MRHVVKVGVVVPYGRVVTELADGDKTLRTYQQGQYIPVGRVVVDCYPDMLAGDLGFTDAEKPKAKHPATAKEDTTEGGE